jgi:hypothetical protein
MRENLASYLAQLRPDFVDRLERAPDEALPSTLRQGYANGDMRWTDKLLRDLERPYNDRAVLSHVRRLDDAFRARAEATVRELPPSMPCRFYITGSLVKGRFGAHSDVDALCDAPRPTGHPHDDIHVFHGDEGGPRVEAFDRGVEIDARHPGDRPLEALLSDALARKGYKIGESGVSHDGREVCREKEVPPAGASGVIWSFSDLPV